MTSSNLSVQLTPGQRCLLDLLERKLLNTIQIYTKADTENELERLKDKIRRISARQKRFTLEIINGNGNNTIPKESFFQALGLVTKEALNKLNSKTNERRRRTTANPRFSHEAIQAKRALEPLQKRLEPRVSKDRRESARKVQRQQQPNNNSSSNNSVINTNSALNSGNTNTNNNNNNSNSNTTNNSSQHITTSSITNNNTNCAGNKVDQPNTNNGAKVGGGGGNGNSNANNQQAPNSTITNSRSSSRAASNTSNELANQRKHQALQNETRNLVVQYNDLERQISAKVDQIRSKRENNRRLEKQNELIRKRGLDIISAINILNPNFQVSASADNNGQNLNDLVAHNQQNNAGLGDQTTQSAEPLDIWIDMKCDESLDGLD